MHTWATHVTDVDPVGAGVGCRRSGAARARPGPSAGASVASTVVLADEHDAALEERVVQALDRRLSLMLGGELNESTALPHAFAGKVSTSIATGPPPPPRCRPCPTTPQMEIDRVKYLLASYLRTRLRKLEKYAFHVLSNQALHRRMSPHEFAFVNECVGACVLRTHPRLRS